MKTLIRNANVALPGEIVQTSVLIENETIADIDPATPIVFCQTPVAGGSPTLTWSN